MASRGSAARVPLPGCALPLLVAQAGGKLALFAQRGESTAAFCSISLGLVAGKLAPNLHAGGPFLTRFLRQPRLKGTFSMQANIRAVFTRRFPSESFISLQPQGPQHQPKLNMGLKLYTGRPRPWSSLQQERGSCLCKCARACARAQNQMCALQNK